MGSHVCVCVCVCVVGRRSGVPTEGMSRQWHWLLRPQVGWATDPHLTDDDKSPLFIPLSLI